MHATAPTVRLIINADDFGLTEGVNRAVQELHAAGALTSATLMANGDAFAGAVANPGPAMGCHIVLVDGRPLSPPDQVPTLMDRKRNGAFRSSLLVFASDLHRGRISEEEIELEATAQIRRLQDSGVRVTHIDSHKHTHLFAQVARPVMRAAAACGVTAIRNPFEQAWSSRLTRGALVRKLEVAGLRRFQRNFEAVRLAAGFRTTDGSIGVSATGSLDRVTLASLLEHAAPGTWELVCHPGYRDAALNAVRTRLKRTREVEREALLDLIPSAVQSGRIQLVNFDDL